MNQIRALIVDDDALVGRTIVRLLSKMQVEAEFVMGGTPAIAKLAEDKFHLVITDIRMPDLDGPTLFRHIKEKYGTSISVVVMTAHATVDLAVTLLKEGVSDFVEKPIVETTFRPRIESLLEKMALRAEVVHLRDELRTLKTTRSILGTSPLMQQLLGQLPAMARSDAAVLVLGESGTGKELMARAIHDTSLRANGPFVTVNCGALPESLLESELFGHVKGAFTDARTDKIGLAVEADGGTLFLDEIGELSLSVQVKLLRFLQEKEVRPVGANKTKKVDVRIVSATNRELAKEVKANRFREDLYYRINILPLRLPPLRHRRDDIPILADAFMLRFAQEHRRESLSLSAAAMQKLLSHSWPGNIRELENVLRRASILAPEDVIQPSDLTIEPTDEAAELNQTDDTSLTFQEAKAKVISDFERSFLTRVMTEHHGNISRAAEATGKDRKSFWELLQKYNIDAETFRPR